MHRLLYTVDKIFTLQPTDRTELMALRRSTFSRAVAVACLLWAGSPAAGEIYRWVDADGVVNFSGTAPVGVAADVSTVTLEAAAPPTRDPGEDLYNVAAQAERMEALREKMEAQRAARREQQAAAQQAPEQDRESVRYGYPYDYRRPPHAHPPGRPPSRPSPPETEPYETSTLRPPGQSQQP